MKKLMIAFATAATLVGAGIVSTEASAKSGKGGWKGGGGKHYGMKYHGGHWGHGHWRYHRGRHFIKYHGYPYGCPRIWTPYGFVCAYY